MLKANVPFGNIKIQVEAESLEELLKEVAYLRELDAAREGVDAEPFFRGIDGYEYFGFRSADGAEVVFGKAKKPDNPKHKLFAYGKNSAGYKGWQRHRSNS